ncbi:MAG: DUF3048 domain-containing protein [Patescibacteria group bacterium]|nr:DUF3048 domain-containing protein [Patescibacteria group bacterium]MCL5431485.1 DUF3048 domain-containing protein [Patescibacteria group bacterium]
MNKEKLLLFGLGLVLYLLSAGLSYAAFSVLRPTGTITPATTTQNGKFVSPTAQYANLPKTEACPLNGQMYSKPERDLWEKRRPLGVMIENSAAARPQSGVSSADIVYEAVAEGGITRLMAIFYCQPSEIVGPVRSARTYYLDWISEYADYPLYAHVGGANTPGPADALGQIGQYGWDAYNDMNQFSIGFPTFWRDYERLGPDTATEHTVYTSTTKLWDFAATKRDLTNVSTNDQTGKQTSWDVNFVPWQFKDDAPVDSRPAAFSATFALSGQQASYADDYVVKWQYDHDSNSYLRFNGGKPHMDLDTNQQLLAKNVVIEFTTMTVADDGYNEEGHGQHTLYGTKGSGKAMLLSDGKVINGTWQKTSRTARTRFLDQNGVEIKMNRGLTWIEVLPIGQPVTVQ